MLKEKIGKEVNSFTIDFENKNFSESKKAKEFAKQCDFKHFIYTHDDASAVRDFPKMIYHCESILNTGPPMVFYGLAKFAKEKVDVILGGEGVDEVFCGYGFQNIEYKKQRLLKWYMRPLLPFIKWNLKRKDAINCSF